MDMEKFGEPISKEDAVSDAEKEAFVEMRRQIETTKDAISEDPHLKIEFEKIIEDLSSEREKEVIRQRFIEGKTPDEIRKKLKLSKERIKMIEARALRKLRHPSRIEKYLDGVELNLGENTYEGG